MSKLQYRSIFISDVHLGTKNCKAEYLLDFLRSSESQYLYLVGDIFDLISMKKNVHWTKPQTKIVQEIFRIAKTKTKVIYIPGNHDHFFRGFCDAKVHRVKVKRTAVHVTADNKRLFVSHGDEFDTNVKHNQILYYIGDKAYYLLLRMNRMNNWVRRTLGLPYWSLSTFLKSQSKKAEQYIDSYRQAALNSAAENNYDGYVCGHIHKYEITQQNGLLYCNTGDWVEHCSALIEQDSGELQILHWSDHAEVKAISKDSEVYDTDIPLVIPALEELARQS